MAAFTTESAVRAKFQVEDRVAVPSSVVQGSIDDAHAVLLRALDEGVDQGTPEAALVLGETLLAGVHLLRSLASSSAQGVVVSVGGQRLSHGDRFAALMALASKTEREAWRVLEAYVGDRPRCPLGATTDSVTVLGEE